MNKEANQLEMVGIPTEGRTYVLQRYVHLGDVNPHGRMRLDSVARAIQDVATADAADALSGSAFAYVLRRLWIDMAQTPVLAERLTMTTFCGGTARSWAERRTSIMGDHGARIEAAAIWVAIDEDAKPCRLPDDFISAYSAAAAGRRVDARLSHAPPPETAKSKPWQIRYADLDTLGHVNNAAHWCAVEDVLAGAHVQRAEIEFASGLMRSEHAEFRMAQRANGMDSWLCAEGHVRSSQRVWTVS
jgi:acyl-ACP thioesterase